MKQIILISALCLTACGSNGGGGGVSTSNVSPLSKRILYITDQRPGSFDQDIYPGLQFNGNLVSTRVATGFTTYQTLNGTQLIGADSLIAGWLAEDHYDAVVFSLGGVERDNDLMTQPYFYRQNNLSSHAMRFANALKSSPGVPPLLVYVSPIDGGGSAALSNNAGNLGIVDIDDGFGFTSGDYQALINTINAKLSQALN